VTLSRFIPRFHHGLVVIIIIIITSSRSISLLRMQPWLNPSLCVCVSGGAEGRSCGAVRAQGGGPHALRRPHPPHTPTPTATRGQAHEKEASLRDISWVM
jgi:hypothetical protein